MAKVCGSLRFGIMPPPNCCYSWDQTRAYRVQGRWHMLSSRQFPYGSSPAKGDDDGKRSAKEFRFSCRGGALGDLRRAYAAKGIKSDYVFVNERGEPFGRMGIARKIEYAGEAAGLPFPIHVHMLRHSTGCALAAKGMDTRRLQHFLGHASITNTVRYTAMSPEPFKDVWR
jgi:integrase